MPIEHTSLIAVFSARLSFSWYLTSIYLILRQIEGWYNLLSLPGWYWYKAPVASGHTSLVESFDTIADTRCRPIYQTNTGRNNPHHLGCFQSSGDHIH